MRYIAATLILLFAACGGGTDAGSEGSPTPDTRNRTSTGTDKEVLVKGLDTLKFEPDELALSAGRHTIVFQNVGTTQHQLALSEEGDHGDHALGDTGAIDGGTSKTLEVDLEAGTYEYACHVAGHYEAGMKGTLTVN